MKLMGTKNNIDLYQNLLSGLIPNDIKIYIEPFGGLFGLYKIMSKKPPIAIYNDINKELYNVINSEYEKVICHNFDYKDIIKIYDNENVFFYFDPPYYKNEHYYQNHNFLKEENHIELSQILKKLKGRFLLSYQDRHFIRELYNDYKIHKYTGKNQFHISEIAITNYV